MRARAGGVLAGVVGFVVLEGVASALYPGGTWWDRTTVGYRFWENYLCDLEWRVAIDGKDNALGALLAKAAMLALLAGLMAFWLSVPELLDPAGTVRGRALTAFGAVSVAGATAVALMPSDRFGALHGLLVIVAGVPGLAASALSAAGLLAPGSRWRAGGALATVLFAVAAVDLAVYARHWLRGDEASPLLPAIQKVGLILLLAWMVGLALRVIRGDSRAS